MTEQAKPDEQPLDPPDHEGGGSENDEDDRDTVSPVDPPAGNTIPSDY